MNTERIVIGKNNPHVFPDLEIWGFPIALYLFLGGLAAGILFFTAYQYIRTKGQISETLSRAAWFAPVALVVGLIALFIDLHNKLFVWRLYTTINFDSPMSWGAWTLLVITPLSILWVLSLMKQDTFNSGWTASLRIVHNWSVRNRGVLAWSLMLLSVVLGVYTGILLSAFNARPLWNSEALAMLFLTSGLSTGVVIILWLSTRKEEIKFYRRTDAALIGLELLLIIYFFMGLVSGPKAAVESVKLFFGGAFTFPFWSLVVVMGLVLPLVIEVLEMRGKKVPRYLVPVLVLAGGLIFRVIIVQAGQVSSFAI